ncbi:flagellar biosynthesis protein FlhB [Kordiimonas lipolytica]|uniref:Flagellar biosynthetic protein FlhB n=1 Tax=Kordiimonas lipolytica TaxID=1662421 RepID=A0ABV8UBT3_9PROT|nr:flagellar biosynthesis protein FlhB [Kordiimonas lipolytica]
MAEQDDSQKTEEPTPKRLREAEEKGDVAQSQEVKTFFMLFIAAIVIGAGGGFMGTSVTNVLYVHMSTLHLMDTDQVGALESLMPVVWRIFLVLLVPFGALVFAAIASNMLQHKTSITFEKIKPSFKKLSPASNAKKWAPDKLGVEAFKISAKLIAVAVVIFIIVYPERGRMDTLMLLPVIDVVALIHTMVIKLLIGVLIVMAIVAAIDFSYQSYQHIKKLRMTKQEVKDEHKQTDGDPKVKGRLRAIRMERSRQRMMAAVPDADVVITNPTHYAVALEYKHGQMDVPRVVAKGVEGVALKIREVATEHNVPIVENPPLARALYATVEIDEEVPPDHYKAVAEVISYILKLKRAGFKPSR